MTAKAFYFLSVLLFIPNLFLGQLDSIRLGEIEISAQRISSFSAFRKIESIDSLTLENVAHKNLGEVLSQQTSIFIKKQGNGGLMSSSIRGAGSEHTGILWNGLNLQNSMNGQADLFLIPAFLLDEIKVLHGGASDLYGSGNVGGTIFLNNTPKFEEGLSVKFLGCLGSFSSWTGGLAIKNSSKRNILDIRAFSDFSENNFAFINTTKLGDPKEYQPDALYHTSGFMLGETVKINSRQTISFNAWFQPTFREIAPPMTSSFASYDQLDESWRTSLSWQRAGDNTLWKTRLGYFDEQNIFKSKQFDFSTNNHTKSVIGELENKTFIGDHSYVSSGISHYYLEAVSENFADFIYQNRTSLFAHYHFFGIKKLSTSIGGRFEYIHSSYKAELSTPFSPSFGAEYKLNNKFDIYANANYNYRLPTFNDLFWGLQGNDSLKAEKGWSQEVGFRYNQKAVTASIAVFRSNLKDRIFWAPDRRGFWVPQNIAVVGSHGIEASLKYFKKINSRFKIKFNASANWVASTQKETYNENNEVLDKQLIYVPQWAGNSSVALYYRNWSLEYQHSYTGLRYIVPNNTESLPYYHLGAILIDKKIMAKSVSASFFFSIENCWNVSYQSVRNMAMPLRYGRGGIRIHFSKPQ